MLRGKNNTRATTVYNSGATSIANGTTRAVGFKRGMIRNIAATNSQNGMVTGAMPNGAIAMNDLTASAEDTTADKDFVLTATMDVASASAIVYRLSVDVKLLTD